MPIRSVKERLLQTLAFEAGALLIVTPVYVMLSGSGAGEGAVLMIVLSVVVMLWSPLHNTVFDLVEWRMTRRLASDRPRGMRALHALSHEVTTMIVTLPVLMGLAGYGFWQAVLVDLALSAAYTVYAFVFHIIFDKLRPMRHEPAEDAPRGVAS